MHDVWRFLREDDRGGGTIFGLLWFALLVGLCGLAVDSTDGFRHKTMLQAAADSASLASVMQLPDQDAAITKAVYYASTNMAAESYGNVLRPEDVELGIWDEEKREFTAPGLLPLKPLNAVRVTLAETAANGNAVAANFLRIMGLRSWDVRARAVAQAFTPKCLKNGIIARGIVDISSNNGFVKEICVHGQQGVRMQNHNYFETGVKVTMLDTANLTIPTGGMTSNPGLAAALGEESNDPRLVNQVDSIMADFLNPASVYLPSFVQAGLPVINITDKSNLLTALVAGRVHRAVCQPNKVLNIPTGMILANVVIIADCAISIGAGAKLFNVVLGSRSGGGNAGKDKAIVSAAANTQIGLPDNCAEGGGVQLFSNATMKFASSTKFDGVQMVAAGDIELGARDMGINGISAQAGGKVAMTSNNQFGLCQGGVPQLRRAFYYRLVR